MRQVEVKNETVSHILVFFFFFSQLASKTKRSQADLKIPVLVSAVAYFFIPVISTTLYVVHNYTQSLKNCVNDGGVSPWVAIYL